MSKSTPAPPDWRGAAEETAQGNKDLLDEQTRANRPDQFNPFGSTQWTQDEAGNWTQTQSLNEDSQRALDAQLKLGADRAELGGSMTDRLREDFSDRVDLGGVPDWAGPLMGGDEARQGAEDAIYGRSASRLDPQWEQRSDQTEAKLAAQGLRPGDPAYDQAMENMGRERTDAYQQATYGSIVGGGQEASRQQDMDRQAGDFQNQSRQGQISEKLRERGYSLNEINAIMSGQQVSMPGMEDFNTAGRGTGADYTGAAQSQYGSDMDAYNAKQSWMNSMFSGLGMMGQAGINYSDRRLKRHVKRIGTFKQYPWYLFQYIWGEWAVGVMADEVNEDAVLIMPNGFAAVDYARIK